VAFVVYHGARHTGLLQAPSPSPGNNHRSHLQLRRVPSPISVAHPSYFYTTLFSGRYPSSTPQSGNLKVNDEILKSLSAIKMEYQNTGPGILQIGRKLIRIWEESPGYTLRLPFSCVFAISALPCNTHTTSLDSHPFLSYLRIVLRDGAIFDCAFMGFLTGRLKRLERIDSYLTSLRSLKSISLPIVSLVNSTTDLTNSAISHSYSL